MALTRSVRIDPVGLDGILVIPDAPQGIVLFAHGSGSSRFSPRNNQVAAALRESGFATLLFDLLTETEARDRANVFDIRLLARRLEDAVRWVSNHPETGALPIGLFGASTGAAAALMVAAREPAAIKAVVSRGGRPDLAGPDLARVTAPTLLVVGGADHQVLALNRQALAQIPGDKALAVVPGATHLFEEPGALDRVIREARQWFEQWLVRPAANEELPRMFADRREAGQALAARLIDLKPEAPLIFALPRGGVPVAAEVARALEAPMDLVLVRKIGAPMQPELAVGAVVDGATPEVVLNEDVVGILRISQDYIDETCRRELAEIERRRASYAAEGLRVEAANRVVIVIDDGVATGATMRAALHAMRRRHPAKLIAAFPVGAPDTIAELEADADEVRCLMAPAGLGAIGFYYRDFTQVSDETVKRILAETAALTAPDRSQGRGQ